MKSRPRHKWAPRARSTIPRFSEKASPAPMVPEDSDRWRRAISAMTSIFRRDSQFERLERRKFPPGRVPGPPHPSCAPAIPGIGPRDHLLREGRGSSGRAPLLLGPRKNRNGRRYRRPFYKSRWRAIYCSVLVLVIRASTFLESSSIFFCWSWTIFCWSWTTLVSVATMSIGAR